MEKVDSMIFWNNYWFREESLVDLSAVRIIVCAVALFHTSIFHDYHSYLLERANLPAEFFHPTFPFKLLHAPFGWGYGPDNVWAFRPDGTFVQAIYWIMVLSGITALLGFFTRISMILLAVSFSYVQSYIYSYGDFHHPEAALAIMLFALALSPSGKMLSIDAWRKGSGETYSTFAGWPLKAMMWFFVLMYWSAVWSKLSDGGLDWANGFTLQYYLARDGLRWGGELAVWLSQFHYLILVGQIGVLIFQATFFLAVIFPKLRILYVPAGLFLHIFIYVTLQAPFFTWIALYAVFIPWSKIVGMSGGGARRSSGQPV